MWGREATLTATAGRSGQHGPPCHPTPSVLLLSTVTGGPEPQQHVLPPTHDPVTSVLSVSLSPCKHEHVKLLGRQPAASLAVSLGGGGQGPGTGGAPAGSTVTVTGRRTVDTRLPFLLAVRASPYAS